MSRVFTGHVDRLMPPLPGIAVSALFVLAGVAQAASRQPLTELNPSATAYAAAVSTETNQARYESEQARALVKLQLPEVRPTIRGTALFLAPGMGRPLAKAAPGFEWWWPAHYRPSIIEQYKFSPFAAPFAVLGDFNKDGVMDAALHGHDRKQRDLVLVLLSTGKSYKVIEIERNPASRSTEGQVAQTGNAEAGLEKFLTRISPGRLTSHPEKKPLVLDREGFQVNQLGKNSTVYYFSRGKFRAFLPMASEK